MNRGLQHNNQMLRRCGVISFRHALKELPQADPESLQVVDFSRAPVAPKGRTLLSDEDQLTCRTKGMMEFSLGQLGAVNGSSINSSDDINGFNIIDGLVEEELTVLTLHIVNFFQISPPEYFPRAWLGHSIYIFGNICVSVINSTLSVPVIRREWNKGPISVNTVDLDLKTVAWKKVLIAVLNPICV